jgi:hypothetical protein
VFDGVFRDALVQDADLVDPVGRYMPLTLALENEFLLNDG